MASKGAAFLFVLIRAFRYGVFTSSTADANLVPGASPGASKSIASSTCQPRRGMAYSTCQFGVLAWPWLTLKPWHLHCMIRALAVQRSQMAEQSTVPLIDTLPLLSPLAASMHKCLCSCVPNQTEILRKTIHQLCRVHKGLNITLLWCLLICQE